MRRAYLYGLPFSLLLACGANHSSSGFDPDASGPSVGQGDGGTSPDDSGGPGLTNEAGPVAIQDCADAAKLIYLVSVENDLYSFDIAANYKFKRIGPLQCPAAPGSTPFSMAVDRTGIAWIDYTDGTLFKVSVLDASCTKSGYIEQNGFKTFGMGFATGGPDSKTDTLFVAGYDRTGTAGGGKGIASLDTSTLKLTVLGDYTGNLKGDAAELTGTGDGHLYGFFEGTPALLSEIDKQSGATPSPQQMNGVDITPQSGFAFAFWGGDFWFFTSPGTGTMSAVTRYKAATDKSVVPVLSNIGFLAVGAGVSTCAPTVPLK